MRSGRLPALKHGVVALQRWTERAAEHGWTKRPWFAYSLAVVATLLATLLRWSLPSLLSATPYLVYYPAVVAVAAVGGSGAGVLATIGSLLCVDLLFDPTPGWVDLADPVVLARSFIFLAGGIGTSMLAGMQRAARIRESRQTEALRQSEQQLRLQWDRMPIACVEFDAQFRFAHLNPAAERIFGFSEAELLGQDVQRLVTASARQHVAGILRRITAGEMSAHSINENVTKDGRTITCEWFNTPLKDDQGRFVGLLSMAQDITQRKRAEEELRNSREDLNRAQTVAQTGSWRLDVRHNELLWSDENHRIFGIPRGLRLTYETFLGTIHPDDRQYVQQKWTAALRGEPYDIEHRIVVGDEIRWVRERAHLEFDSNGTLLGGFGTTQDVTARRRME